jgi:hypothetical protein
MATQHQIDANRQNALKSTGPRTPEGKAVSSQNAFKSGLDAESQFVYGEEREDFYLLQQQYFERFRPASPEERFQVDNVIRNEWMLRRLFRAEAQLWEYFTIRAGRSEGVPLGEALAKGTDVFTRLQRRITAAERSYKESMAELKRLQAQRQAPEPAPQPEQTMDQTAKSASFLNRPLDSDSPPSGSPPSALNSTAPSDAQPPALPPNHARR